MEFTLSSILAGIFWGAIGLWMIKESKRRVNFGTMFIGVGLLIYPYFVAGPLWEWGIGIVLCLLAYKVWE